LKNKLRDDVLRLYFNFQLLRYAEKSLFTIWGFFFRESYLELAAILLLKIKAGFYENSSATNMLIYVFPAHCDIIWTSITGGG